MSSVRKVRRPRAGRLGGLLLAEGVGLGYTVGV
jgi:hypothetical protein